jgi:catechol 2,3-dioxygenase-like lactoylglutathione lyase family enzyme
MTVELFAGLPVTDRAAAVAWYERLLGSPPSMYPNDTEAVFDLAEHRYLYVEQLPDKAGNGFVTLFLEDYDARMAEAASRGVEPVEVETYDNGVRKAIFLDPDGNEIGFGGGPR